MIYIGLSGNRYSGKDRIARIFKQIHIPVFDADLVLRFAIHYNVELLQKVKKDWGEYYFGEGTNLDMDRIQRDNKFGKLVKYFEKDIFEAYNKFNLKNKNSIYTIFHSSILFESDWYKRMDQNISVFSPTNDRIERCKFLTDYKISDIYNLIQTEMEDLEKNNKSDYIIHNYESSGKDVLNTICEIDKKVIDLRYNIELLR